jgi:hypothetical protein
MILDRSSIFARVRGCCGERVDCVIEVNHRVWTHRQNDRTHFRKHLISFVYLLFFVDILFRLRYAVGMMIDCVAAGRDARAAG